MDICSLLDSNLLDCSCNNTVALALGSSVYIWNAETCTMVGALEPLTGREPISSLCWSEDGRTLSVGTRRGEIQVRSKTSMEIHDVEGLALALWWLWLFMFFKLWDVECKRMTRCLLPHLAMVRAVSWKQYLLSRFVCYRKHTHTHTQSPFLVKWY